MHTAYITIHKGKRGLRFVCKCGARTWLRTNKQEYIEIDERAEVKSIIRELAKQIRIDGEETRRNNHMQYMHDWNRRWRASLTKKFL